MLGLSMRSSSSCTLAPPSASSAAIIRPVGPAPTTTTSDVSTGRMVAASAHVDWGSAMLAVLFAHAVATALAPLLVYRWGRKAFYPLALVPLASLIWVAQSWPGQGLIRSVKVSWVSKLSLDITLRFDSLAAIMSVLVLGIGALVLFYCADYFHHHDGHTEKRLPSFAAELVAFSGAMFGLVVSDNMLVLYVFWELTTVLSFLLVGHYAERASSRKAAVQALLVTTAGGLAMLVGIIVLGTVSGSYLLSEVIAAPPTGLAASVAIALILVGALAKSAIVPLHFWLPGAMAAPTPVSAYLHAAAMVKAGVYLVARMNPGFADSPPWRPMVITLGVLTVLLAGWRAIREYDLKLILAFGTVSQLGFITVMVGAGGSDLMLAGLALLCAHAMFKAALFMVVGIIDHTTGTRDIRRLAWLGHARTPPGLSAGWPGWATPASHCSSSRSAPRRAWRRCPRSSASLQRKPTMKPSCRVRLWDTSRRSCSVPSSQARCSPRCTACVSCGVPSLRRAEGNPASASRRCTWHR